MMELTCHGSYRPGHKQVYPSLGVLSGDAVPTCSATQTYYKIKILRIAI